MLDKPQKPLRGAILRYAFLPLLVGGEAKIVVVGEQTPTRSPDAEGIRTSPLVNLKIDESGLIAETENSLYHLVSYDPSVLITASYWLRRSTQAWSNPFTLEEAVKLLPAPIG